MMMPDCGLCGNPINTGGPYKATSEFGDNGHFERHRYEHTVCPQDGADGRGESS